MSDDLLRGVLPIRQDPRVFSEVLAWVQGFIRDDRKVPEHEIECFLLPSSRLTAAERLRIHREQYWIHVRHTLAGQLPQVERFMGHPAFETLLWHYMRKHPLRSWSLNHMKRELPDFLLSTEDFKYRSFIRELAMLEIAGHEVQWAAPQARLTEVGTEPVTLADSVQMLAFQHRVLEYMQHEGETVRQEWGLDVVPNRVLVHGIENRVDRWVLEEDDYYALTRLRAGERRPEDRPFIDKWLPAGVFTKSLQP